jgi:shikimate dehydrogenase
VERIVLTGFRGSGKTAVGRRLAEQLGLPLIDTDDVIEEQAKMTIPEIFAVHGETVFREYERRVIAALPEQDCVVATGGGAVMDPVNVGNLRRGSTVFYLEAPEGLLIDRIRGSNRPALTQYSPEAEVSFLLGQRRPFYVTSADFCIDAGAGSSRQTAGTIRHILEDGCPALNDRREAVQFMLNLPLPAEEKKALGSVLTGRRDPLTRICAILGYPCSHSRSPLIYNRLFSRYGLNYYYTWIQWHDPDAVMQHVRRMCMRGLSVTIPFKETIVQYLDSADEHVNAIGAANTVVRCGDLFYGFNTDWVGIMRPLSDCSGERAVVLGAGGAAAAAVYALQHLGMDVTVLNRTQKRAQDLAERFGCAYGPPERFDAIQPDVIVHATPVGMGSNTQTLLTRDRLRPEMTVFDLVYTPPETPLLREAKCAGCTCISGVEMFIHQLCEQFRHFTGIRIDPEEVRKMMP